jgi:hypothetical protein
MNRRWTELFQDRGLVTICVYGTEFSSNIATFRHAFYNAALLYINLCQYSKIHKIQKVTELVLVPSCAPWWFRRKSNKKGNNFSEQWDTSTTERLYSCNIQGILLFFLWRNSPTRAQAASLLMFLDQRSPTGGPRNTDGPRENFGGPWRNLDIICKFFMFIILFHYILIRLRVTDTGSLSVLQWRHWNQESINLFQQAATNITLIILL